MKRTTWTPLGQAVRSVTAKLARGDPTEEKDRGSRETAAAKVPVLKGGTGPEGDHR
jgi:hypothetical protein